MKEIYNLIFQEEFQNTEIKAEKYCNAVFGRELPWSHVWKNNYNSYVTGKQQDILFKIMHKCLPTGERLQKILTKIKREVGYKM